MNLKGSPAHVGRHCGSNQYEITREGVDFYADALDEPNPEGRTHAPPLLHHSECYEHLGEWYLKNLFGNLHAQQDWELYQPIPIGATVRLRSTIIDRFHKRGRDYVVNETACTDAADGRLYVRGRAYQSFLPPREEKSEGDEKSAGFVVDESTAAKKSAERPRPPFPTATGRDFSAITKTVDQRRCWMFSGPGRNYHTDKEAAQKFGFPNIVVQGMMSTCFVSEIMEREFGPGWLTGGRMSVKLTNVVWVDDVLEVHGRIKEERPEGTQTRVECEVWIDKVADGTRVLLGTASALI
jgi:acyl dehydratase